VVNWRLVWIKRNWKYRWLVVAVAAAEAAWCSHWRLDRRTRGRTSTAQGERCTQSAICRMQAKPRLHLPSHEPNRTRVLWARRANWRERSHRTNCSSPLRDPVRCACDQSVDSCELYRSMWVLLLWAHSSLQLASPRRELTCNTKSHTIRYDTKCYFNVRSKADISQLNLPHGTDN